MLPMADKATLKKAEEMLSVICRTIQRCKLPPGVVEYMLIGHRMRGDGSEVVWWVNERGDIEAAPLEEMRFHFGNGSDDAEYRGRVDHTLKQVSVAGTGLDGRATFYRQRLRYITDKLAAKFPGYAVFVVTPEGLLPLHEILDD